ncbi:hypothetical protein [Streptomyces sp. YIM 121038]|uniref:hypothetical protein n=1 Tax=Streptomyces sp. YIM 121038 TaxID=2136401 RepID=UPI0011104DA4|nr:hypothetical protein [Streptomyces sp. YIM 121038]
MLDATHSGWICPDPACEYTQDWAHAFMARPVAVPSAPAVPDAGRRDRYAAAIRTAGDAAYGNSPFYEAITRAVLAVADAEQADLRAERDQARQDLADSHDDLVTALAADPQAEWADLIRDVSQQRARIAELEQAAASSAPADRDLRDRAHAAAVAKMHEIYSGQIPDQAARQIADAVLAVLPAPADKAAVLHEAADAVKEMRREYVEGELNPSYPTATEQRALIDAEVRLRRMADEAQQDDGAHVYLSTGCHHGDTVIPDGRTGHEYCQTEARRYDGTTKVAGTCKVCGARCICPCHAEDGAQQDEVVVMVHAAPDLSPEAEQALGALIEVAKRRVLGGEAGAT